MARYKNKTFTELLSLLVVYGVHLDLNITLGKVDQSKEQEKFGECARF